MALRHETRRDKLFVAAITTAMILIAAINLYPVLNTLAVSFSSSFVADRGEVSVVPRDFTFASWRYVTRDGTLWRSLANTIYVTAVGTALSLIVSALFAYALAQKRLRGRSVISLLIVFTMIFRYPLIPYFLAVRAYGIMDTHWALILPHLIVVYNVIILRTFFRQVPESLAESAVIDGAGDFRILFQIVMPISKPALATVGLFYAVTYWNLFLHPTLFIRSQELLTLQPKLRALLDVVLFEESAVQTVIEYSPLTVQAATIMFATIPILFVYPFLQKHFVKGATLGSIKG